MIEDVSGKEDLPEQSVESPEAASGHDVGATEGAPSPEPAAEPEAVTNPPESNPSEDSTVVFDSSDDSSAEAAQPVASHEQDDENDVSDIGDVEEEFEGHAEPIELVQELVEDEELNLNWFILKVASNRENSIADALRRRVKIEGLDKYFDQVIVPVEEVAEFKNGKKRIVKRKLYPGYICVHMHVNDDTWFVVRDTPGIGDFTGAAGKPTPMLDHEVERILPKKPGEDEEETKPKIGIKFKKEDRVRIKEGTFENFEGDVEGIDEANGRVTVVINIFDRPTPVEIDHWQLESVS